MKYAIKCISNDPAELNNKGTAGPLGWFKSDRGYESWCASLRCDGSIEASDDINEAYRLLSKWDGGGAYSYVVEEFE